jgi:uncharacterized membrane protein
MAALDAKNSLKQTKLNWSFLTFWLAYLSLILGLGYAVL